MVWHLVCGYVQTVQIQIFETPIKPHFFLLTVEPFLDALNFFFFFGYLFWHKADNKGHNLGIS